MNGGPDVWVDVDDDDIILSAKSREINILQDRAGVWVP
jgi:hypothetical protein